MIEPASPPTRLLPVLALCPELRRPMARLWVSTRHLTALLLAAFPDAHDLARDRTIAEHIETTPHDHLAADAVAAAYRLLKTLDGLARPITLNTSSPGPFDDCDF